MDDEQSKTITIGLAMSGAISAGAYSAGVLDFLIEALDEWEKRRDQPGVPGHRVVIAAAAGASAGAITSAMGMIAAARGPLPRHDRTVAAAGKGTFHTLPDLYRAWVDRPDFLQPAFPKTGALLDTTDLARDGAKVVSLLNSLPLEEIGREALAGVASGAPTIVPRPYLSSSLHVYMTLTNLRGVPYQIAFDGDVSSGYGMMSHGDRAHYQLSGAGSATFASPWADRDHPVPAHVTTLPPDPRLLSDEAIAQSPDTDRITWVQYIEHTLCSGAFPIGLSARDVSNPKESYIGRSWPLPVPLDRMTGIHPSFPASPIVRGPDGERREGTNEQLGTMGIPFAGVDGGALDNDPFQIVRYAIMSDPPTPNESDPAKSDRLVMMISPFPDPPAYDADDLSARETGLMDVVRRLLPTFMQNARFKPEELVQALHADKASRWLVSPRRYDDGRLQEAGIACGLLGGFGGFLDIEFRRHDYELGRKNCQDFLAKWFTLGETNGNLDLENPIRTPQRPLDPRRGGGPAGKVAVIPLLGTAAEPVLVRDWPRVDRNRLDELVARAMARAELLIPLLAKQLRGVAGVAVKAGWSLFLRDKIASSIRYAVLADLVRRDQFADPLILSLDDDLPGKGLSGDELERRSAGRRKVLGALIGTGADFRTVAGIVKDLLMDEAEAAEDLERCIALGLAYRTDKVGNSKVAKGTQLYCYKPRTPAELTSVVSSFWSGLKEAVGAPVRWTQGVPAGEWSID
ncbi:hypothetical protein HL658_05160 [Azospirillum sp. RWY-5-1]|uniref:PNPLA domain-containing protein n=1 Tax=Azospirillum oleiclasticum TaxID=2735135 RepID=A0ABX2T5H7_9PROT|nr:patatin-like phospholipase family protein [Azospirillum oleiclasticum]NYZ11930.1 hypothetical protein [Azospirillum oleiclasticum]NYZ19090.1 hypothetical protein [Azospirillum oleiclasticum]